MFKLIYPRDGNFFYATHLSSGFDISANEDKLILPGQFEIIGTGLQIVECSDTAYTLYGYRIIPELQIRSRSGLSIAYGITVHGAPCTIDGDYRNEIKVPLFNCGKISYQVKKGNRIAQGVCCLTLKLDSFSTRNVTRTGGMGSTGE